MFRAITLGFSDVADPRILAIMLQALAVTALVFAGLACLAFWLLSGADPCSAFGADACPFGAGTSGVSAIILIMLAVWFLFPAVAIAVLTAFLDRFARAVEERHYPEAAREAHSIGIARSAAMGLRSAGRLLLFNLIALPFYILLLVTGFGPFVLFVIVNGIAFGRDLGELAAARHGDRQSRLAWLRSTRGEQHLIGTLVSVLFLVPLVNLVAPVVGIAAAIHLFNRSFSSTGRGSSNSAPR